MNTSKRRKERRNIFVIWAEKVTKKSTSFGRVTAHKEWKRRPFPKEMT